MKDFVALPVGTLVGRYVIAEVLGHGGFGITYRARDSQLNRDVAIKEYLPTSLAVRDDGRTVRPNSAQSAKSFAWARERFIKEGRTLAALQHTPAIVPVHDFLEANGTAYIIMALVRGKTLEQCLKERRQLLPAAIDKIIWPLLDGLAQVHAAGFVHRDIKPANIILSDKGHPTLVDFGSARAEVGEHTSSIMTAFTPNYAAPEQFNDNKQGPWTDIYSLSATLYRAITGEPPGSVFDRMQGYEALASIAPAGFDRDFLAGIDAGLSPRAADRPQSIPEWRTILRSSSSADTTILVPGLNETGAALAKRPSFPKRRGPLIWTSVALAIMLILGSGYFLIRSSFVATTFKMVTSDDSAPTSGEGRKADAASAAKKKLEEEAGRQAQASQAAAAAQRTSEEARARAAADAVAKLVAENDAQHKVEAEATMRLAEQEAAKKAAAEVGAKRQADEALARAQAEQQRAQEMAARQTAELETRQKVEAETKAQADADAKAAARARAEAEEKAKSESDARAQADALKAKAEIKIIKEAAAAAEKKAAEAAENTLKLTTIDRQRLQVALTSSGFPTNGADGVFGPRSREMIAAWQKARNQPATGFLGAEQHQTLLREAAAALGRYDAEQAKVMQDKPKAIEEAKPAEQTSSQSSRPAGTATTQQHTFDGWWEGQSIRCAPPTAGGWLRFSGLTVRASSFSYTFTYDKIPYSCTVAIQPNGSFDNQSCTLPISGQISGNIMKLTFRVSDRLCSLAAKHER